MIDVLRNKTSTGRDVYNPKDPNWYVDAATHIWKAVRPGILDTGERFAKAATGHI